MELERQLVDVKADLKIQKAEVAEIVEELEARGRELSRRTFPRALQVNDNANRHHSGYESISLQTTQLSTLPAEISSLRTTVTSLRAQQTAPSTNPSLSLPLPATLDLLSSRQAELDQLNQQLKSLQKSVPRKARELELLERELKPLEVQKAGAVAAAKDARRIKEEGEKGLGNELELKGRWYRGVEMGLREMLGVEA